MIEMNFQLKNTNKKPQMFACSFTMSYTMVLLIASN